MENYDPPDFTQPEILENARGPDPAIIVTNSAAADRRAGDGLHPDEGGSGTERSITQKALEERAEELAARSSSAAGACGLGRSVEGARSCHGAAGRSADGERSCGWSGGAGTGTGGVHVHCAELGGLVAAHLLL